MKKKTVHNVGLLYRYNFLFISSGQKGHSPNMNMFAVLFLWNFDTLLPDYTSSHPREQQSSQTPQGEPQM
jgi:hypothetical protein